MPRRLSGWSRDRSLRLPFVTAAAQQIAQRKHNSEHDHEQRKKTDEVPRSQHHVTASGTARHQLFGASVLAHALMMSIGSGKTMVVFFSTPISVSVCK